MGLQAARLAGPVWAPVDASFTTVKRQISYPPDITSRAETLRATTLLNVTGVLEDGDDVFVPK